MKNLSFSHRFRVFCWGWVGLILLSSPAAHAAVITVPGGLSPGDEYRLVFVTSVPRDATSTNIADYNTFVTGVADLVPELVALNTQWSAIGGTSGTNGRENTGITASGDVPVFRLDGQVVVNDAFGFWNTQNNDLLNPVQINESGALESSTEIVFTGLLTSGLTSSNPLGGANVNYGKAGNVTTTWLRSSNESQSNSRRFYAVSGILTAPDTVSTVTTPGLLATALLLAAAAAVYIRRRRIATI